MRWSGWSVCAIAGRGVSGWVNVCLPALNLMHQLLSSLRSPLPQGSDRCPTHRWPTHHCQSHCPMVAGEELLYMPPKEAYVSSVTSVLVRC